MEKLKVATIGFGGRGASITNAFLKYSDEVDFVACVEPRAEVRNKCAEDFGIKKDMLFDNFHDFFEKGVIADILVITTMDYLHYEPAMKAMNVGYKNIILEKPIALSLEECKEIIYTAEEKGVNMAICHVLRYDPFFVKLKEVVDSGVIGEVMNIQHTEGAGHIHYTHSFVRGHMSNTETSAPFIMQKCCHDFDLLVYLLGKRFKKVSSFGKLTYFKEENAPEGSGTRCTVDCKCQDECIYDAKKIYENDKGSYVKALIKEGGFKDIDTALKTTCYGRCVYKCGNDVCDHQVVNIEFEDNITASLTVSGFDSGRRTEIGGTRGRIEANHWKKTIMIEDHMTGKVTEIKLEQNNVDMINHMSQDIIMERNFLDVIKNNAKKVTPIGESLESHLACFAAEIARMEDRVVYIDELR